MFIKNSGKSKVRRELFENFCYKLSQYLFIIYKYRVLTGAFFK
jgi:hypothetical protein